MPGRLFIFSASIYLYEGTIVDTTSDNVRGSRRAQYRVECSTEQGRLDSITSEAISFAQDFIVKTHDLGQWDQTRFQGQRGSSS